MTQQTQKTRNTGIIILITVLAVSALGLLGFILWQHFLPPPELPPETTPPAPTQTVPTTTAEATTSGTTEPTLMPYPLTDLTAADFGYVDGVFTCVTRDCLMGIDVSKYQGKVDWEQVKAAGYDFVMIRVGYRGYGKAGTMRPDDWAKRHYKGAKEAGLLVGAYFFSQSVNEEEAREEALYALELTEGWELDLPIVYDWEYIEEGRAAEVDIDTLTRCAKAFCEEISDVGRRTMIYVSPWFGNLHLDQLEDYPQWLARYTDVLDYPYRFEMWQYTSSGTVPGVNGPCDINILFPYDW
jgi:GH25 family lysozyme M1 (1,4-beta-N-acetylmuramidase)